MTTPFLHIQNCNIISDCNANKSRNKEVDFGMIVLLGNCSKRDIYVNAVLLLIPLKSVNDTTVALDALRNQEATIR